MLLGEERNPSEEDGVLIDLGRKIYLGFPLGVVD
jgi:hypothetical protein